MDSFLRSNVQWGTGSRKRSDISELHYAHMYVYMYMCMGTYLMCACKICILRWYMCVRGCRNLTHSLKNVKSYNELVHGVTFKSH
jgi:hypothetical protein